MILDVKDYVKQEKEKIKKKVAEPVRKMLILQVGDNPASNAYIKGKIKDAEELGHRAVLAKFSADTTVDEVYAFLEDNVTKYDGVILQEPANFSAYSIKKKSDILNLIPDFKDIDGFKRTSRYSPATPRGIMDYLDYIGCGDLRGQVVAVVGKGKLVGEPIVPMLMKKGATVISCNSTTPNLGKMLLQANIVIAATGVRGLIKNEMISDDTIIIDAGINVDEQGKLHGDVDPVLYERDYVQVTPVPGGVGLLTRLSLMKNLLGK